MSSLRERIHTVLQFERESSYRFPSIVAVLCVFIAVGIHAAVTHNYFNFDIRMDQTPAPGSADRLEYFSELILTHGLAVLGSCVSNCVFVLILLVPLLVAYNFTTGYSSGLMQTLLTYPISRASLLLMKFLPIFLLVSCSACLGSLAGVFFFVPVAPDLGHTLLLLLSIWTLALLMVSVAGLVAVISRNALVTSFGCVSLWFMAFIGVTSPETDELVKMVLFPPFAAANYAANYDGMFSWWAGLFETELVLTDVLTGMVLSCALALLLLLLSHVIFKYTGV